MYDQKDGPVNEITGWQVNIQGKYQLYNYSLPVGGGDPSNRRRFVGTQQEMWKLFYGWSLW